MHRGRRWKVPISTSASRTAMPVRRQVRATERHSIQSVDRAMTLLEAIAETGGEATLTELSHRTGLNISTCHHLLSTLVQRGYVAKVPVRRSYALGARILYLEQCLPARSICRARAQPLHRADQRADRRDRASRGAAGRRDDEASPKRESRHAGARRYRHARQDRRRRTRPRAARRCSPGCPRTTCAASSRRTA